MYIIDAYFEMFVDLAFTSNFHAILQTGKIGRSPFLKFTTEDHFSWSNQKDIPEGPFILGK